MKIKRFNSESYYEAGKDTDILSKDNRKTSFTEEGRALIQQYYRDKYNAQIVFLSAEIGLERQLTEIANTIHKIKNENPNSKEDRRVFVVQDILPVTRVTHAIVIAYVKENGEDGILYADSLGENISYINKINELTGINIYSVKENRQADGYSCFTDAFVFSRDITKSDNNGYHLKDLLKKLKERSENKNGYWNVKLPNELLKTPQISKFVSSHQSLEEKDKLIHKNYNLFQFREKYTDKDVLFSSPEKDKPIKRDVASYVRVKGNKYADIIQIQFYLNEMAKSKDLPPQVIWVFKKQAKIILASKNENSKKEEMVFELAKLFLNANNHAIYNKLDKFCEDCALAVEQDCFSIFYETFKKEITTNSQKLFVYALHSQNAQLLDALLKQPEIILGIKYNEGQENELSLAIKMGSLAAIEFLLSRGANLSILSENGDTPLHQALLVLRQDREIVKLLLNHGANANLQNKSGDTPLHYAVQNNIMIIDLLLDKPGINPFIKNEENKSPYDMACAKSIKKYKEAANKMKKIEKEMKEENMTKMNKEEELELKLENSSSVSGNASRSVSERFFSSKENSQEKKDYNTSHPKDVSNENIKPK